MPLAPLTTLRIGPVARRLITCDTTEKVVDVMRALDTVDALVLAGGSNVVLADDLADLTVVLLSNTEITVEGNIVRAEAGAVWDDVVVTSLAYGLGGLECLSGIPGSAGATPVQNVGAYGAEVSRHDPSGAAARPAHRRGPLGGARGASVRLPDKHSAGTRRPR